MRFLLRQRPHCRCASCSDRYSRLLADEATSSISVGGSAESNLSVLSDVLAEIGPLLPPAAAEPSCEDMPRVWGSRVGAGSVTIGLTVIRQRATGGITGGTAGRQEDACAVTGILDWRKQDLGMSVRDRWVVVPAQLCDPKLGWDDCAPACSDLIMSSLLGSDRCSVETMVSAGRCIVGKLSGSPSLPPIQSDRAPIIERNPSQEGGLTWLNDAFVRFAGSLDVGCHLAGQPNTASHLTGQVALEPGDAPYCESDIADDAEAGNVRLSKKATVPARFKGRTFWSESGTAPFGLCINCSSVLSKDALVCPGSKAFLVCRDCKSNYTSELKADMSHRSPQQTSDFPLRLGMDSDGTSSASDEESHDSAVESLGCPSALPSSGQSFDDGTCLTEKPRASKEYAECWDEKENRPLGAQLANTPTRGLRQAARAPTKDFADSGERSASKAMNRDHPTDPVASNAKKWACEFDCGFRSSSYTECTKHENRCSSKPVATDGQGILMQERVSVTVGSSKHQPEHTDSSERIAEALRMAWIDEKNASMMRRSAKSAAIAPQRMRTKPKASATVKLAEQRRSEHRLRHTLEEHAKGDESSEHTDEGIASDDSLNDFVVSDAGSSEDASDGSEASTTGEEYEDSSAESDGSEASSLRSTGARKPKGKSAEPNRAPNAAEKLVAAKAPGRRRRIESDDED